jgi:hypothetical protein
MLVIKFIILAFTLASPSPAPAPKAGSAAEDADQPMRARKRSSERMAMALMRRTETGGLGGVLVWPCFWGWEEGRGRGGRVEGSGGRTLEEAAEAEGGD